MENLLALDLIRGTHLLFMAAGLGPALYFDLRTVHRIAHPIDRADIDELNRIHKVISFACVGLWATGALLIWFRTGFQLSEFSPKLWNKIVVVSVLTVNAVVLSRAVIPLLTRYEGSRMVDMPVRVLLPVAVCAGVSFACWMLALVLGSSQILKTAGWDVLTSVEILGTIVCVAGVVIGIFLLRAILHRKARTGSA